MVGDANIGPARQRRPPIPDRVDTDAVAQGLRDALTGSANAGLPAVVWEDRGSQVLLHVASLQVRTLDTALVVAIDTETAELGRAQLIVRLVFGTGRDPAALVASSDEVVHGDPRLAARWGPLFRDVVWSAIVRMSEAHAGERGMQARAISILGDHVRFTAKPAASVRALAVKHRQGGGAVR
jgi:hypothetical protein